MAVVIGCMGESGSGKTTAMRNLPKNQTFYIDSDKKGLNWKGWRDDFANLEHEKVSPDRGCYYKTDKFAVVASILGFPKRDYLADEPAKKDYPDIF